MNNEQIRQIFDKLPRKRKHVLLGVVAGHNREKILCDAELPSEGALTAHLKELYKDFKIDTVLVDADDRRSGERKRHILVALIRDAMPERFGTQQSQLREALQPQAKKTITKADVALTYSKLRSEQEVQQADPERKPEMYAVKEGIKNLLATVTGRSGKLRQDWGDQLDVSNFYGRSTK